MRSMKQTVLGGVLLVLPLIWVGCDGDENPTTKMNVDYPAAYVVDGQGGTISVIDLTRNEVAGTIQLRDAGGHSISWPHHISLSPDGQRIAVGVPGMDLSAGHGGMEGMSGQFLVIDANTGATLHSRTLPAMTHNAAFSPDGQEIWVGQMAMEGSVMVFDAETYLPMDTIMVGMDPAEITFSSDHHRAFVACGGAGTVTAIDPQTKTVIGQIPVGENPVGAWPGMDGMMYTDNEDGHSISMFHHDSLQALYTLDLGFKPGYAAFHPQSGDLWVTNATAGEVAIYHEDQGSWMQDAMIPAGADAHAIAFTMDGLTAYVTNQGAGTVSVIDIATRTKTGDILVGGKPNGILLRE